MKNTIFLLFFCLFVTNLTAQVNEPKDVAKRKLGDRINAKVNEAMDKGVDKALDGILGKKTKKEETTTNPDGTKTTTTEVKVDNGEGKKTEGIFDGIGKKIGGMLDFNVQPKQNYTFSISFLQKMTVIDKGKTETGYIKTMLNAEQSVIGMNFLDANKSIEGKKGMIIMDVSQQAYFMFSADEKGNKSYFGMHLKEQPNATSTPTNTDKNKDITQKKITPTGKTKTIMGYNCEGYQQEGDKGDKFIYWVTSSKVANMDNYYKSMKYSTPQKQNTTANGGIFELVQQGKSVLGHDYIGKEGNQVLTEMEKISLNDTNNFSTVGYKSALGK